MLPEIEYRQMCLRILSEIDEQMQIQAKLRGILYNYGGNLHRYQCCQCLEQPATICYSSTIGQPLQETTRKTPEEYGHLQLTGHIAQ